MLPLPNSRKHERISSVIMNHRLLDEGRRAKEKDEGQWKKNEERRMQDTERRKRKEKDEG